MIDFIRLKSYSVTMHTHSAYTIHIDLNINLIVLYLFFHTKF